MPKHQHRCLLVFVDCVSKMAIMIPCKKTTTNFDIVCLYFIHVWSHFSLPSSIVSDRDSGFPSHLWNALRSMLDTKHDHSIAFHRQTNGQINVVDRTSVHLLCMYNHAHPHPLDESIPFMEHTCDKA